MLFIKLATAALASACFVVLCMKKHWKVNIMDRGIGDRGNNFF